MTRVYYREAVGALVVFDMTRLSTFQATRLNLWQFQACLLFHQVTLSNGRPVPAVLLANKCDQRSHGLCPKLPKLDSFYQEHGLVGCFETSAKDDTNVDAAITCLVKTIIAAEEEKSTIETARSDVIILPRLDCDKKEKGLGGCSGCPQVNPKTEEMTKNRLWI
ncbi:ras-related protein Rab-38-like [Nothobranchius furzeri]|uniref:ras-related protein Rab-38-like n=1 Tax=Nothobranchius furzeri TaxID=105023 RepID=UPI00390496DC